MSYLGKILGACLGLLVVPSLFAVAQDNSGYKGGSGANLYQERTNEERKAIPYAPLRQADVMYARRIHQKLDMREKQNLAMQWPRNPFNELVYKAVMKGIDGKQLTPYQSDSLKNPYTREKVIDRISTEETVEKRPYPIERPNYTVDTTIRNTLAPSEIKKFRIMEEWIFDKETSQYTPRIIAVAPLFKPKRGGAELEEQTIFWVEWNELRKILVNETMFNRKNDAARLTYYDFFEQRLYSSYIVKYPTEFDQDITDMPKYEDSKFAALIKAQKIEQKLLEFEHDLWQW
jgi:gliding motility associated protien GldN